MKMDFWHNWNWKFGEYSDWDITFLALGYIKLRNNKRNFWFCILNFTFDFEWGKCKNCLECNGE